MKNEGVRKRWDKYKWAAAAVLIGVVLLLWPSGNGSTAAADRGSGVRETAQVQDLAAELEEILSAMSGVGQVKVLLTMECDGQRSVAENTELSYSGATAAPEDYSRRSETVLADGDSGSEAVVLSSTYPTYRGALIVCQGGDRPEVQLAVTQAVSALTGLSSDHIAVAKWQ